jgi:hypothetical protein
MSEDRGEDDKVKRVPGKRKSVVIGLMLSGWIVIPIVDIYQLESETRISPCDSLAAPINSCFRENIVQNNYDSRPLAPRVLNVPRELALFWLSNFETGQAGRGSSAIVAVAGFGQLSRRASHPTLFRVFKVFGTNARRRD